MILVCEPQCKNFSHEKVNSGFLTSLCLAFPNDSIGFYADPSHIKAIQDILSHDQVTLSNLIYYPTLFGEPSHFLSWIRAFFIFKRLFHQANKYAEKNVFFLSYSPSLLYIIKKLKGNPCFEQLSFNLVLHGGFETIAPPIHISTPEIPTQQVSKKLKLKALLRLNVRSLLKKTAAWGYRRLADYCKPWSFFSSRFFSERKILFLNNTDAFTYISLSPHILKNATAYIDTHSLDIKTIVMPINFSEPMSKPQNAYPKFAIFGYGNSKMLYQLLLRLKQMDLKNAYEIRIIGMDHRGTDGFDHVTVVSPGKPLKRAEMEHYAKDIDFFLILYEPERYRLSCSGSVFEALSYTKPILNLKNECIDTFNTSECPIGYSCTNIDELSHKMAHIIENFISYTPETEKFLSNIMTLRETYSINKVVEKIQTLY